MTGETGDRKGRAAERAPAAVPERILAAASDLLATEGIAALTQPRVSRAAGVLQSHLTYYFPRRTDLMLAVARHALGRMLEQMQQQAGAAQPRQRAKQAAQVIQRQIADPQLVRLMLGVIVASEDDASIKASIGEFVESVRGMLHGALEQMGLDADPAGAATLHALAVGLAVLHLARGTEASRDEVGRIMARALPRLAPPAEPTSASPSASRSASRSAPVSAPVSAPPRTRSARARRAAAR